jgi:hypothetical protein
MRRKLTNRQRAAFFARNPHINILRGGSSLEVQTVLKDLEDDGHLTQSTEWDEKPEGEADEELFFWG